MLDIQRLREDPEDFARRLADLGHEGGLEVILELDRKRREGQTRIDELKHKRNARSKEIGGILKSGGDATELKEEVRRVGDEVATLQTQLEASETQLTALLATLPNLAHESVPIGKSENDNVVVRTHGEAPELDFEPRPHWDVGVDLGILDFEAAARMSGARFVVYLAEGAQLERALIQFMLDFQTRERGYTEVIPPLLVQPGALYGTGQLPKFEKDLFKIDDGEFYLIPTAEVPLTNLHREEILDDDRLPLTYCAYTPCFRSEAGSYGKDVRGLIRQHQFNKVELVHFSRPEESYEQLEILTANAEEILRRLGLHYRVMELCTGDLGFGASKTYDLEVWLPSQGVFREISSCSNCGDFQARRARIRYRPEAGAKARLLHTLNGSGLAVGRTLVAILENYQNKDGSVTIPPALQPYMHGMEKIGPR
ncbi:MAG: serine--tRNA ligase [Acidobacteriota bacterium]|nr:serine--tRNA ligase [Acidobacteriota bacterium]MDH3784444.1 serine--tRNA ligase [Acidobacteriota bacterium]